jgi:hypothetical protein
MRYAPGVVVALCILLLATLSAPAQGQLCSDLQAVPGAMGYQHRSASARCEGLYQSPVAGERLEFLSFVSGSIHYDLMADKVLVVAVPDVSQLEATEVHVRARALPLSTYYRMDTTVATAKAIEWPLNSVIAPAGLHVDSLGVIGWIEKGVTKIYIPLFVLPKGKSAAPQLPVIALFRSPIDIEKVRWRLWATGTTEQSPPWQDLAGHAQNTIRAGEPIRLPIAASSQLLNLEIAAKIANADEWLKTQLRVFIP